MKRIISIFLCAVLIVSSVTFNICAVDDDSETPVLEFDLSANVIIDEEIQTRASGLITATALSISKSGTKLTIDGLTYCVSSVVRCGFKNLTVERRANSSSSWEDYYEYGNVYIDECAANLSTSLTVESGYQYRVTTKHYAKKSLLVTQTISNESNIIQF